MPPKWGTNPKRRYRIWETEDSTQKGISRMMVKANLRWISGQLPQPEAAQRFPPKLCQDWTEGTHVSESLERRVT